MRASLRISFLFACALSVSAFAAMDGVKVTTDRTVDSSSLESIVSDVIRLSGAKTNDEKAIALYRYLHEVLFHRAYPNEKAPQSVGPLKVINVYGWGLCGGQHTVMKAVFEAAGWEVRYRGWSDPGHTTVEVKYDDRWHYFDVFLKSYFWTKDKKTIAGQDDIIADPSIVLDAEKEGRVPKESFLCCGDDAPGIVKGCKNSKALPPSKHEDGWASVTGRDKNYNTLLSLRSGGSLKLEWSSAPGMMVADGTDGKHTCPNMKDFRNNPVLGPIMEHYGNRSYSNGQFSYAPDFSKASDAADIVLTNAKADGGKLVATGAGSAVFKLNLPYAYASAKIDAGFDGSDGKISISPDSGKTWQSAAAGDVSAQVRQRYDVWVKVDFAGSLSKFKVDAVVEHNRGALPFFYNGKNLVTVSTADNKLPAGYELCVTYAYQEATAPAKRNQYNGQGVVYGETKKVEIKVASLPFNFDIEVGGTTPPKMLYLERTLRAK
jgi:hypothetical protein